MIQRITFTDPAGIVATYVWPVNPGYDGMPQPAQKVRAIERTSNTGNVGATKQQGDDGPLILHYEPLVFHIAHETALWRWWQLCKTQSIYMTDVDGSQYEGQITTLGRQIIGAAGGPGDTNQRGFYCKYVIEFEIWRIISGIMAGVAA